MFRRLCCLGAAVLLAASVAPVRAATPPSPTVSVNGSSAVMRSGSNSLSDIGYIGTYITVPPGGSTIKFTVNAAEGRGTGAGPHLNVVVADTSFGMTLGSTAAVNYDTGTVTLPAGTYVVRVERDYENNASSKRAAQINKLSVTTVSGGLVKISNTKNTTNAMAAANTYIDNFRKGNVNLQINGLAPGTPVDIHMTRNAFDFGTNVAGGKEWGLDSYLSPTNTDPQRFNYMAHLAAKVPGTYVNFFNTVTPEDAGKWLYQELGNTQPAAPDMSYIDDILNFAQTNDMKVRMHNLMWDYRPQQPTWVSSLIDAAKKGNATARQNLTNAINNRIQYLMNDRAGQYLEMDGLNEALLTGKLWSLYGGAGVAYFYNNLMAAAAANGNPNLRIFTNEYNVLQSGKDSYGNWYSKGEVEAIRNQGGQLGGIGMQYYVKSGHSPARIMQTLQNLSVQDLPLALTEFGVQRGISANTAASYLSDTMQLMYGTADATDFILWGFWQGHIWSEAPGGALWDKNWNLTPAGQVWTRLMQKWSTTLDDVIPDDSGDISFNGYWGDYDVVIGDQHYDLTLTKGVSDYVLNLVDPNQPIFDPPLDTLAAEDPAPYPFLYQSAPSAEPMSSISTSSLIAVPEPSGIALGLVAAAAGLFAMGRRRSAVSRQA